MSVKASLLNREPITGKGSPDLSCTPGASSKQAGQAERQEKAPLLLHGQDNTLRLYRSGTCKLFRFRAYSRQTRERIAAQPMVLCLQDTTELDFNGQGAIGLGPLSYEAQRGMYLRPTYAATPQREPLGVLDAWMWAREKKDKFGVRGGPKESLRWIEGDERVAEMALELAATRLVYVADREADLMPSMARAEALGTPADWLIRASHNRCLPDGEKLWQHTTAGASIGEIAFTMASRHDVKARVMFRHLEHNINSYGR
jgi:hypothetical protein